MKRLGAQPIGGWLWLLLAPFAVTLALAGCGQNSDASKAAMPAPAGKSGASMPVPVTIAEVRTKSVPEQLSAPGTVEAYTSIAVKAQVGGQLEKVFFKEGEEVKAGDLLFKIDPRPLQAALHQAEADRAKAVAQQRQAEATLVRDRASAETAQAEAGRYEKLVNDGVVSRSEWDKVRTESSTADAAVKADQAAIQSAAEAVQSAQANIENAKVQLGYTEIYAPIGGRTGNLEVDEGNLVKEQADSPLVTINQVSPIYVTFSVPEQYLPQIKRYMAGHRIQVTAKAPQDEEKPSVGELIFMDNQVGSTGQIKLKATFPNEDHQLWPGQFVKVSMTLTVRQNMVVVPSPAIQVGQQGSFVFVVKPELTAEMRSVKVGDTVGREVIVAQGLKPGEKVVTDGQLRLTPGTKVKVTSAPEPAHPIGLTSDQPAEVVATDDAEDTTDTAVAAEVADTTATVDASAVTSTSDTAAMTETPDDSSVRKSPGRHKPAAGGRATGRAKEQAS